MQDLAFYLEALMKIFGTENNRTIRKEIANRIKSSRINFPMTREELAEKSGVSLRTIARIEAGETTQFDNIISILRAMNCLDRIDLIFPDDEIRPSTILQNKKTRKRATSVKYRATGKNPDWEWKEDSYK